MSTNLTLTERLILVYSPTVTNLRTNQTKQSHQIYNTCLAANFYPKLSSKVFYMTKSNTEFKLFSMNKNAKTTYSNATTEERIAVLKISNCVDRAIDETERCEITGISRATWNRYAQEKKVPRPFLGSTKNRWMLSEILVFMYRQSGIFPQPHDNQN